MKKPARTLVLAAHVIAALAEDFERHGPPLVLRLDRIACQRTAEVRALLRRYEVLPLHGPPRHPYYYGQLERQNREHRAWQRRLGDVTTRAVNEAAEPMRTALNAVWARPTLDWRTAEECWLARPALDIDRAELRVDVERRARGLLRLGAAPLAAERMAIESALVQRRLLTLNDGGLR